MAMAESAQNFEVAQLWDSAFTQREIAHAMAAQRQRTARIRQHKLSKIAFAFMLLALGATGGFVGAGMLAKEPTATAPIEQVLHSHYAIVPVAQPIVDQVAPPSDASSTPAASPSHKQPKAAAVAVVPAPARPSTVPAATITKTTPAAASNSPEQPSAQGKYYEARPDIGSTTSINTSVPMTGLKVINVPVDGVLQLDVDGAVRAFKVGDALPDGSRLKHANAQSGTFETTARRK